MKNNIQRCAWVSNDPLYINYHDNEWGKPVFDDKTLFEFLILEGAQAGLSWITVLKKRENYRKAFHGFNPEAMAHYDSGYIDELLKNPGIIRNRLKIHSAVNNARAYINLRQSGISLSDFLWQFVGGEPIKNHFRTLEQIPSQTALSEKISQALKKQGFKFVGSTICYAYMQAVGMVDDHTQDCFCYSGK